MPTELKKIDDRFTAQRSHYQAYVQPKQEELSHYIMPERGRFDDYDLVPNDGKKRFELVVDSSAGVDAQRLAAAMLDGLSPPDREWIRVELERSELMESTSAKGWLDTVNKEIKSTLSRTNFYNIAQDLYEEEVVFGTGSVFMDSDPLDVVRFTSYTAGTYYIASNNRNIVDRWYRRYSDTVQNIVDKFGLENTSLRVQTLLKENKGNEYINLRHALEPNTGRDTTKEDNRNMPFSSTYYEEGGATLGKALRESGYVDFPVLVPRYRTVGSEVYGQSPCNRALGPTQTLQEVVKDNMKASKKTIDPPKNVPDKFKNVKMGAGTSNFYDSAAGESKITAVYQINYDFASNQALQEYLRSNISKILNSDLFSAISNIDRSNMTATEVNQRVAEAIKMLVAVVARMNSEFLKPVIERLYTLLLEAGRIPEPPDEIAGQDIKIIFISSLAQAQQAVGIASLEQLTDYVGRVASFDPSILDKFNSRQAADELMRKSGAPPSVIRSDEEVAQIDATRQADEQQAKTAEALTQMADGAQKLGNTPLDQNTALDQVMGRAAGA